MTELDAIKQRLQALEGFAERAERLASEDLRHVLLDGARWEALNSLVLELAQHQGIDPEKYHQALEARVRFFHQLALQRAEAISPTLAAEIDNRPIGIDASGEPYPPLIP